MNDSRAIIFARVSTKRQEAEGLSLEEIQLPQAREYARKKGLNVVKEFKFSETGSSYKRRDKFNAMIDYVEQNGITDIVSFRVDRMTRNFNDSVTIDRLRREKGVRLHFIDDRLVLCQESRASDITQWDFKVMFAKSQLERIREDGINTKMNKLERGELPWMAPYGYENVLGVGKARTVIPEPFKSEVVRRMFTLFSTGTYSCESLRRKIFDDYAVNLSKSRVHSILRDKFYIGLIIDRKNDEKEYPHFYEQIIDNNLFETVQDVLDGNRREKRRFVGAPFAYRGLIVCELCGCAVTTEYRTKTQKNGNVHEYKFYHCTNARKKHDKLVYIREDEITDQLMKVFEMFEKIPEDKVRELECSIRDTHESENNFQQQNIRKLTTDRKMYKNRIKRSFDAMADGSITPDDYNENKRQYDLEIATIDRKLASLEKSDQSFYVTAAYLLMLFRYGHKIFEVANEDEKRQIVGLVLSNLKMDGKELDFNLKEPFATALKLANGSLWQG